MPISFNQIPAGWKIPLVYIEVDPSQAGTPTQRLYALLVGHMLSTGTAVANVPVAVGNLPDARDFFGRGSMLARMFERFVQINKATPVVCLPVQESLVTTDGGVKAHGTITVTAAPTDDGVFALYIAGQRMQITLLSTDSVNNCATKINAAINAALDLPVTSTVLNPVVTVTSRHKGICGNDIVITDNYLGKNGGELMPLGFAVSYSNSGHLTLGSGVPDWTAAIAALGDEPYEYVAMPFSDTGSLSAWDTEYGFSDSGRWGWLREDYGLVYTARRDTYSGHFAWGPTYNSGVISVMAFENSTPGPMWEAATAYAAQAAGKLSIDPGRPLQTLTLDGILPAPKGLRFNKTELNALAGVGLAVQSPNGSNVPAILREQTQYQLNTLSQPDNAYELVTTLSTLAALFRRMKQAISNKFPRSKLANDGTRFGPGQAIVTPLTIKGELIAEYRLAEFDGLVENGDTFKKFLIVERDSTDPNRINVIYPPDVVNQLRMFAVLAQFRLQFSAADVAAVAAA